MLTQKLLEIEDLKTDVAPLISEVETFHDRFHAHLAYARDSKDRAPGIHASEISKCFRRAVYTMRGEPKQEGDDSVAVKAYWAKVLEHGSWIHSMLQTQLEDMAEASEGTLQFEKEVPIHPNRQPLAKKWNIHSSCDGILTHLKRNEDTWKMQPYLRYGLEIKSASTGSFASLRKPYPDHVEQVHVYMAVLNLPMCWIMYYDKNTQNITPSVSPWLVKFDAKIWEMLERRFSGWFDHLKNNTVPEAKPGKHCEFCPYQQPCKGKGRLTVARKLVPRNGE